MVNEARKAELEGLSPLYIEALCQGAGLDTSGSKEELIDRLLEAEAGEDTGEPGEGTGEGEEGSEPGEGEGSEESPGETEPTAPEA